MTFNSLIFIFLVIPIFYLSYFKLKPNKKIAAMFVISFLFYFWIEPIYSIGLLFLCFYIFILCKKQQEESNIAKRNLLIEMVSIVLFLLAYFKYYGFVLDTIGDFTKIEMTFKLFAPPAAISFIAFTLISYIVDCYKGKEPAKNFIEFGAYVFFFPKILMGPIMRFEDFKGQGLKKASLNDLEMAIRRFIVGLGKKVILADSFALVFSQMSQLEEPTMLTAWLCAFAFSFQIYFDFSGYSDMAIAIGNAFGYKVPENFNYPYISKNIKDFWKRWHISLSTWFRDYVYIPLGGSRCNLKRVILNTFIVWFLTGLWHGASWNFVLWGLYYFLLLIIERYGISKVNIKISRQASVLLTFILVTIGWVFFSYTDFTQMLNQFKALIGFNGIVNREFFWFLKNNFILFVLGIIGSTPFMKNLSAELEGKNEILKTVILLVVFMISIAFIIKSSFTPFLYVQF